MMISSLPQLPEQRLPQEYRAALGNLLSALAESDGRVALRSPRRYALAGVAALATVSAGGALAYSQLTDTRPVTDQQTARCYSEASYLPGKNFSGSTVSNPESDTGRIAAARDACAGLWRAGIIQPGVATAIHDPDPDRADFPVPDLIACVLPDGRAAVFPGESGTCQRLGLQAAEPASSS